MREIDIFLKKESSKIAFFRANTLKDSRIVALILTELYFRSTFQRVCEIGLWISRYLFKSKKLHQISVGLAQIKLCYWESLGFIHSVKPTIKNIFIVFQWSTNYFACKKYVDEYCNNNYRLLPIDYRGSYGKYHMEVYNYIYNYLLGFNFT